MGIFKNLLLTFFVLLLFSAKANCDEAWINDLTSLYQTNSANIYAINVRTFNAKDTNKDGIIQEDQGEERGTFLNAIDRLDELASYGINTIDLLPVTPVGKTKALGTAGSLYATSSFNEINPQLKSPNSGLSINEEMRKFIQECHKRKIRVIVDLPCCGSYDLFLKNPDLFLKDKNQNPLVPTDWTDVRLLNAGTNSNINMDVYNLYAEFVDLMVSLDVDGIRANVATIKPYSFWKKLIDETKSRNPQFLFIAEASAASKKVVPDSDIFTPYEKLLDAGFDGYYGGYSELKNWKTSNELISHVKSELSFAKKYAGKKAALGDFATHDQISPLLVNGIPFSKMIIWLNATLPINAYYVDGFSTGDDYIYFWGNKKAPKTFTDDDYYFVHRGQLDIFNFSRKPQGRHYELLQDFVIANRFKLIAKNVLTTGDFTQLRSTSPSVFAYERSYDKETVVVIGNLDFKNTQSVNVYSSKINSNLISIPIKISSTSPKVGNKKIEATLAPGEVEVIYFKSAEKK